MYLPSYLTLAAKGLPINGLKPKSRGSFAEFTLASAALAEKLDGPTEVASRKTKMQRTPPIPAMLTIDLIGQHRRHAAMTDRNIYGYRHSETLEG
jgi:hypothetical protein